MTLNRDDILAIQDIKTEKLHIPEWGGDIYIKGMSGTERDDFEASLFQSRGKGMTVKNIRAKLASYAICDEAGNRLFTDQEVMLLGKKSAKALQRIFAVAQRLSGIGPDAIEEYKEALDENPFDGSVSASPSSSAAPSENS